MSNSFKQELAEPSIKYAWYVVAILTLANISSFLDRQILALLVGPIKRDMHLSDTKVSLLMGLSFALFYTLFGVLIGRLADKYNRRNIVTIGITIWSLLTALCAGVKNYPQFFIARMGVGIGEATLSPSAYSIITDYFPKRKLGLAQSVFSMGIFLGSGLALSIGAGLISKLPSEGSLTVPLLGEIFHWQKLFLIIGIPGLIISILLLTIKEPIRKDNYLKNGKVIELSLKDSLRIIFRYPTTYLGICFGTAFTAFVSYGCTAWIPTYLNRTFQWAIPKAGLSFGLLLLLSSITGVLWGGWYADKLKNSGIVNGRLRIGLIAGSGILFSSFVPLINNPNYVLLFMFIPTFLVASCIGASTTALQELMPNQVRALSAAIYLFIINMIGLGLGPLMVAFVTDYILMDELQIKYSIFSLLALGGAMSLLFYYIAQSGYTKAMTAKLKE